MNRYKYIRKYERAIKKTKKYERVRDEIIYKCIDKKISIFESKYPDCVSIKVIDININQNESTYCKLKNVVGMITNGMIDIEFDIDYYIRGVISINSIKFYNNLTSKQISPTSENENKLTEKMIFKEHFLYGGEIKPTRYTK